jgi:hypothetical protein
VLCLGRSPGTTSGTARPGKICKARWRPSKIRQDALTSTRNLDVIFFSFSSADSGLHSLQFYRNGWHRLRENHRLAPAPFVNHAHPLEIGIPVLSPSLFCFLYPRHRISRVTISSAALATSTVFPSLLLAVTVVVGCWLWLLSYAPRMWHCVATGTPGAGLERAAATASAPRLAPLPLPDLAGPLPFSLALSSEHLYRASGWPGPFVAAFGLAQPENQPRVLCLG